MKNIKKKKDGRLLAHLTARYCAKRGVYKVKIIIRDPLWSLLRRQVVEEEETRVWSLVALRQSEVEDGERRIVTITRYRIKMKLLASIGTQYEHPFMFLFERETWNKHKDKKYLKWELETDSYDIVRSLADDFKKVISYLQEIYERENSIVNIEVREVQR